jgi:hypothetical protein
MNPSGHGAGATPDPIPNSEVKPGNADDTTWVTAWESRTPPELFFSNPASKLRPGFLFGRARQRYWGWQGSSGCLA